MKLTWRVIPIIMLLGLFGVFWKSLHDSNTATKSTSESSDFPDFQLTDLRENNKTVRLNDLKGKTFVVHIWASWCGTCLQEHPFWVKIAQKYDFPLVGITYRDSDAKIKSFLSQRQDPYTHLLADPSGVIGLDLGLAGIPATFVVNEHGKILATHYGEVSVREFEHAILPLLTNATEKA